MWVLGVLVASFFTMWFEIEPSVSLPLMSVVYALVFGILVLILAFSESRGALNRFAIHLLAKNRK